MFKDVRLLRKALRITFLAGAGGLCLAAMAYGFLAWLYPFPCERLDEVRAGGSALILDRDGGVVAWRVDASESWRLPVRIENVSPWLVKATVAAEDERFWSHPGVDPVAVARAVGQNLARRRRFSGASTITMQVVRLLWPKPRTYPAKCVEAFRALELEDAATKPEVLELYFNLAPYGGNVVGVEAASRRYFGKSASDLSLGEAALLAGLPQSPARYNPARHLDRAVARRSYVLRRMLELGLAGEEEIKTAERKRIEVVDQDRAAPSEPPSPPCTPADRLAGSRRSRRTVVAEVVDSPRSIPAPRFADYALSVHGGGGGVINTTLDPDVQALTVQALGEHTRELYGLGVDGLAAVVVNVEEAELAAMVGAADPRDPLVGCVNAATARRQPGSLLKPFIYAAAFDVGLLTPRSVVYDVPTSWRGYSPSNIDREFLGPIAAERALTESRNVPAVRLLDRIGVSRLARDMVRLGLKVTAAEEKCGLSLALGTAELRLVDIVNAYAALARLGRYRPLILLDRARKQRALTGRTAEGRPPERAYSARAAYLALRALGASVTPEKARPVWKTGTSWNHRDAWAVVLTPKRAVGVWCGRLSGGGHRALLGATAALPLALDITERLSGDDKPYWPAPPGIARRRACALSGAPATRACPHTVDAEYLPGVTSEAPCSIHRLAGRGDERESITIWPPDVAAYLASVRTESRRSGSFGRSACPDGRGGDAARGRIEILSPTDGAEYVMPGGDETACRALRFAARASPDVSRVYWYLDGELLARTPATDTVRWQMTPGRHGLITSDGRGRSARVCFRVSEAARLTLGQGRTP